jgi:hypothetical protein
VSKIFSPYEASQTLPLVRRIVADVLERGQELRRLHQLEHASVEDEDRAAVLAGELQALFDELEEIGCSFRCPNFEFGLIDFPGVVNGELVHLCWKDDEPELRYYHDPRAGFAGRKPIPQQLLVEPQ